MKPDGSERSGDEQQLEFDALLTEYEELRAEIRLLTELRYKRAVSGTAALGAVIGYALISETMLALTLIPFIIGFLFIMTIQSSTGMMFLGRHVYDIEQELDVDGMGWEERFGGAVGEERGTSLSILSDFDVSGVPEFILYFVLSVGYLVSILVSLWVLYESEITLPVIDPFTVGLASYLVLTLIAAIAVISHAYTRVALKPEDRQDEAASETTDPQTTISEF